MKQEPGSNVVASGIDLSDFYLSVEWDILEVPASRNEEYYPCCTEPYSGQEIILKFALKMIPEANMHNINISSLFTQISRLTLQ